MLNVGVTAIGNSMGTVLPKETLAQLRADKGAVLLPVVTPDGLTLAPCQQHLEQQLDVAAKVMK